MSDKENIYGLSCPNCGGMVVVPEGQSIVRCPFCSQSSYVKGERGLRRYQVTQRIQRENALEALGRFFTSSLAIARDTPRLAQVSEAFLVNLPFWAIWGRMAGWAFGEKRVGSGDDRRYEPREVRLVQEMTWTEAACDVGEFGVSNLLLTDQELEPFNSEQLHRSGMVFEPVNSFQEARQDAEADFQQSFQRRAGLDRLSQLFARPFRQRHGLVYYPLWVLRYLYKERAFQVVVDGYSGEVLYGKAPGNTIYRAAALVLGMAAGAFLAVDVTALIVALLSDSSDSPFWLAALSFAGGLALMYTAYRRFRYGEQYEVNINRRSTSRFKSKSPAGLDNPLQMIGNLTNVKDVEEWIKRLS
jgi:hypothetical protein